MATALSNAVMDIDNAREFSKLGGVALLQDFLESKDEELEQIAISTIANIASSGMPILIQFQKDNLVINIK